jgi:hypothetical protein
MILCFSLLGRNRVLHKTLSGAFYVSRPKALGSALYGFTKTYGLRNQATATSLESHRPVNVFLTLLSFDKCRLRTDKQYSAARAQQKKRNCECLVEGSPNAEATEAVHLCATAALTKGIVGPENWRGKLREKINEL